MLIVLCIKTQKLFWRCIIRAVKIKIRGLKKSQFKRLKELTHYAKNLYNQSLWTLREAFYATGKYFSYPQMDKAISLS